MDGEAEGDGFGACVALSADGSTLAAGGPKDDVNGEAAGHAEVYQYNSVLQEWSKQGEDLDGEAAGDWFGYSLALSADGSTLAAGGPHNEGNGFEAGHVRVYQYEPPK